LVLDHITTMVILCEITTAFNGSVGNKWCAEFTLPVLLSTRWIEMYDRELQQMLGLSALCRFVIHGSDNRPVHLPVNPVQFALYLKARCLLKSGIKRDYQRAYDQFLYSSLDDICLEKSFFSFGSAALTGALRISEQLK